MPLAYKKYDETLEGPEGSEVHYYNFTCECTQCHKDYKVKVKGQDLFNYHNGESVQLAFPYLSAGDRELLCMSNICDACFKELFAEEDEF